MSAPCFALLLLSVMWLSVAAYPFHASCVIDWTVGLTCQEVKSKIISQIHAWEGEEGCADGGEKCLYKLVSEEDLKITATHETPKAHYVDDLTFTLKSLSSNSCAVHGYSTSETWYAVLDKSTNYCNLHNLITGAGLDKSSSYSEMTKDSQCTQYSSANCDVY